MFIYLAMLGLGCSTWDFHCVLWGSVTVARALSVVPRRGESWFPDQELNLPPLHCKVVLTSGPPGKSPKSHFL